MRSRSRYFITGLREDAETASRHFKSEVESLPKDQFRVRIPNSHPNGLPSGMADEIRRPYRIATLEVN